MAVLFDLLEGNLAVDLVDDGHMLGLAALEQLLHAGKTLGDVVGAGNAAGVEGTHGQLGARLANGLSGDNAHGLAHGDRLAVSQRGAVALAAHAVLGPAVQHRADLDALHAPAGNQLGVVVVHQLILGHQHIAVFVAEILHQITANETLLQRLDGLGTRGNLKDLQALGSAAVVLQNDDLLGDIHQTAGQVTGVGGTQSRIRQALPGASGGNEVFENGQAFTIVSPDGNFNGLAGGVGNVSAHAGQLVQVGDAAAGAGVRHHEDGVVPVQALLQGGGHVTGTLIPHLQYRLIAFALRQEALVVLGADLVHLSVGGGQHFGLLLGNGGVAHSHSDAADRGILIALGLDFVQNLGGVLGAVDLDAALDDLAQLLFAHQEVHLELQGLLRRGTVHIAQILRDGTVEDHAAHGGVHQTRHRRAVEIHRAADLDLGVQGDVVGVVGHHGLVHIAEHLALALFPVLVQGQVVGAQHHILGGNSDRPAVGGLEQVVGGQHQEAGLGLGLGGQRHMNSHLVTVKVGVVSGADQGVQLQGAALYQHRLEGLDAQTVQGRRAV